ncbi:MAG TPA: membrane protein insertase YidC [Verrucomicrobiae bacterium]|jgi:YidC/Oxa1 family membrane protein insertase
MDKTGIIIVSLCVALLIGWVFEQAKVSQQQAQQQAQFLATNIVSKAAPAATPTTPATTLQPAANTTSVMPASPEVFDTNFPENLIVVTNGRARYTFTSRGGGLKQVDLLDFPETISARWREIDTNATADVASLNTRAPLPVLAVLGDTNLVGDGNFTITPIGKGVRAEKLLPNGLRVVKDFLLTSNYLVNASVQFQNVSDKPLTLPEQEIIIGTATPMGPDDVISGISGGFNSYGGAMWYDGTKYFPITLNTFNPATSVLGIFPRTPVSVFLSGTNNVVWAAAYNQFYVILAMPKVPAAAVLGIPVILPQFSNVEEAAGALPPRGIQTGLVYPAQTLTANSDIERQIVFYAGPKEYRTLANIGIQFNNNHADDAMNFGSGYISFWGVGTFFAQLLLVAMNWLHDTLRISYGWTIVVITLILKALFWPFTAIAVRSAKKMQALGPEIKALKEKYKDDPTKAQQKQMELWKKHGVSPLSGCFPMLVQMPVFFGFLAMLRSAIELRGAHFLWVADLTKPDTIFLIPGTDFPFNLLPLLMVAVMVWQAHVQPASPGMDPSQQKMMRYMPLIFLLFLYNYSSGMALYMMVSTLLGILQTKITRNLKDPTAPGLTVQPKSRK